MLFRSRTARCVRPDGRERKIELGNKVLTMLAQTSVPLPVGRVFLTHRGKPYQRKKSGGGQLKTALANAAMETGIKINARILKQIRKARLLGTRPDIDEPDDTTRFEVVTRLIKSTLTKYRGLESNASAD